MKYSTDRILTTHTGSLPRPMDLVEMIYAKEGGEQVDEAALTARIKSATAEIVRRQVEAGVEYRFVTSDQPPAEVLRAFLSGRHRTRR